MMKMLQEGQEIKEILYNGETFRVAGSNVQIKVTMECAQMGIVPWAIVETDKILGEVSVELINLAEVSSVVLPTKRVM